MKRRILNLSRFQAKRVRAGGAGKCIPFTWSRLRRQGKRKCDGLKLMAFWRCAECLRCFTDGPAAKKHVRQEILPKYVKARIK